MCQEHERPTCDGGLVGRISSDCHHQPRPGAAATTTPRRGGLAGAYLSVLGLTLTNPLTILSFAALFAGLGISNRSPIEADLMTVGVFAGSGTWWIVLTSLVAAFRSRITPAILRGINVVSGVVIGVFGVVAIVLAIRG